MGIAPNNENGNSNSNNNDSGDRGKQFNIEPLNIPYQACLRI
jgi:hypothetical protein